MANKDKAKHAFGNLTDVQKALDAGLVDAHDILFLDGETEPKVGWIDKNGVFRLVENDVDLSEIKAELDEKASVEEVEALEGQIAKKVDASEVQTMIEEHSSSIIEVIEF